MSRLLRDQRMPALKNEQGTAIIAALLILMLLTFMAIAATNTTISEKAMVRSESIFEQNFYKAESAAMEGVQQMTNATLPKNLLAALSKGKLLRSADSKDPQSDLANLDTNDDGVFNNTDINTFDSTSKIGPNTYRIVIQMPIASGSSKSLTQTGSRLYTYAAYGLSMADRDSTGRFLSVSIVKIGIKKRF
ncbi:hypothetical protein BMS3Abin13_00905 [bacterium BMS3Abin13]|nr:hypothetical protein BMS3Abin13_00905 [bacterium BMS3Abin13]